MKQNYRFWKNKELEDELSKLKIKIMESYGAKQSTKKENRPRIKKEIARIKTIIKERKDGQIPSSRSSS